MTRKSALLLPALAVAIGALTSAPALSQSLLMRDLPKEETRIGLRWMRPSFKEGAKLSTLSGDYDFGFDAPIGGRMNMSLRLPLMRFTAGEDAGESGFGNIYVGVETRQAAPGNRVFSLAAGIYAPTMDREKPELGYNGWITNPYEIEKTAINVLPVRLDAGARWYFDNGTFLGLEFGPAILFPIRVEQDDIDVFLHGAVGGGFRHDRLALLAEYGSEFWATSRGSSPNRFYPLLALGAEYSGSMVQPGVFWMFQFDDVLSTVSRGSLGIKVDVLPFGEGH